VGAHKVRPGVTQPYKEAAELIEFSRRSPGQVTSVRLQFPSSVS